MELGMNRVHWWGVVVTSMKDKGRGRGFERDRLTPCCTSDKVCQPKGELLSEDCLLEGLHIGHHSQVLVPLPCSAIAVG